MKLFTVTRAVLAALIVLSAGMSTAALADLKNYEFQLVDKALKEGEAILQVRLVDKTTGKSVPDAVIFATRLDMAPDGMPTMTTKMEALPSSEEGVYRFKTNLSMAGRWQLSLGAKVQGEAGSLENKLILEATP